MTFQKLPAATALIIGDAENWPAMEGRSLSGYQQKRVWVNDGAGKFNDVAQAVGATDTYDGRSVVAGRSVESRCARCSCYEPTRAVVDLQEHRDAG